MHRHRSRRNSKVTKKQSVVGDVRSDDRLDIALPVRIRILPTRDVDYQVSSRVGNARERTEGQQAVRLCEVRKRVALHQEPNPVAALIKRDLVAIC